MQNYRAEVVTKVKLHQKVSMPPGTDFLSIPLISTLRSENQHTNRSSCTLDTNSNLP